ncbi:MAG TPA: hypothetical protein VKA08_17755 [Balneolales bacterium]|nr:hypothetical protein [Balneolales bacterium]
MYTLYIRIRFNKVMDFSPDLTKGMIRTGALVLFVLVLSVCCYQIAIGQSSDDQSMKPEKYKNVTWYEVDQSALVSKP